MKTKDFNRLIESLEWIDSNEWDWDYDLETPSGYVCNYDIEEQFGDFYLTIKIDFCKRNYELELIDLEIEVLKVWEDETLHILNDGQHDILIMNLQMNIS